MKPEINQEAEWQHTPIWLEVNARDLDGSIQSAKIISVGEGAPQA